MTITTTIEFITQRFSHNNGTEELACKLDEIEAHLEFNKLKREHPEWELELIKRTTTEENLL